VTLKQRILHAQEMALCLVRKWWRPVTCIGIAGGAVVNLIVLPIIKRQSPNLAEAAAFVTACAEPLRCANTEKSKARLSKSEKSDDRESCVCGAVGACVRSRHPANVRARSDRYCGSDQVPARRGRGHRPLRIPQSLRERTHRPAYPTGSITGSTSSGSCSRPMGRAIARITF
jgi:hypothetical protein